MAFDAFELFSLEGIAIALAFIGGRWFLFCTRPAPAPGETTANCASKARPMIKSEREVRVLFMILAFLVRKIREETESRGEMKFGARFCAGSLSTGLTILRAVGQYAEWVGKSIIAQRVKRDGLATQGLAHTSLAAILIKCVSDLKLPQQARCKL